ncbi:MAG TPA: SMP-30/gluconolactonase/LRE family protein [Thermoanaerobaculia bacterium]|nr:SMP-30/gluconolactonase/LRE family protein [Thermoanaerobaculia bacterium]
MPPSASALAVLAALLLSACATLPKPGDANLTIVPDGPEDFEYDAAHQRLIVGSHPPVFVPVNADGTLGNFVDALATAQPDLHMVGISLTRDGKTLYAINKAKRTIDIFDVTPAALVPRGSLPQSDLLRASANEVFAARENEVYVTNAQGSRAPIFEALTIRRWATVAYWNGTKWIRAADRIGFANGMQMSSDERTLYVAGFQEKAIHVYSRNADGTLTEQRRLKLPSAPDNLKWDDEAKRAKLVVAVHPSQLRTSLHIKISDRVSAPSRVLLVDPNDGKCEELYRGDEINAASTAFLQGKNLYISQIRRGYLLRHLVEAQ